ncbi:hypothetical protein GH742_03875 [Legionella sp. MW5194]|uniref:hypothetical protein n=1 Tax=Legionella sp. MW5194 TaxID=2662448 RepID=UPI00193DDE32|nr:hypothetical protein [Legionella sp. MW5194]QRN03069.1 hypothetical protein GH742_03875 [Legionella sp. MW5194]
MLVKIIAGLCLIVVSVTAAYADLIEPSINVNFVEGYFGGFGKLSLSAVVFGIAVIVLVAGYMRKKR